MKTSLTAKQKLIYAILITICLLYASYALIVKGTIASTKAINAECDTLRTELQSLQPYIDNKATYLRQIEENNKEIAKQVDEYLPEITHKDMIGYAQAMWDSYKDDPIILAFKDPETVKEISYSFADERDGIALTRRAGAVTYEANYSDVKRFLAGLKDSDLRVYMKEFSASLDQSTGKIVGKIDFTARSVLGSQKEDRTYSTANIPIAVRDIFGDYHAPEPAAE